MLFKGGGGRLPDPAERVLLLREGRDEEELVQRQRPQIQGPQASQSTKVMVF